MERKLSRIGIGLLAAAALGVAVLGWRRSRKESPEPRIGRFANGVEYASWGEGPRTLLWLQGGPGSDVPRGGSARLAASRFQAFLDDGYTVWSFTRRRNMPAGHTVADMAGDVAEVIREEFGRVDVVVGLSFGSLIAQYLAAEHADLVERVVLALSGVRATPEVTDIDLRWAEARATGRLDEAGAVFLEYFLPGGRWDRVRRRLGPWAGRMFADEETPAGDLRLEARVEAAFDSRDVLPRIGVPVLLLAAGKDRAFTPEIVAETEALIPDCTVVRYEGKGHVGAAMSGRVPADVVAWLHAPVPRGASRVDA
ncbi:MAG: alpha/beta fold hydrolase [Propionibacteriaceae bacterium]|nr:alpha/beta fold hydrolase [Propionibacteriaceae bacterium]